MRYTGGDSFHVMGILYTILIGLVVGAIAKLLMPGRDPGGWIITALLGIAGAFVGTYLGQALNLYRADEPAGFIGSVIGAMLLLFIYRLFAGRRGRHV
jgi:uncharacterized membrane protein YeaQ/YmgE (transglycosylase-associated protein family)